MGVEQARRLEKNLSKFTADAYVKKLKRKYDDCPPARARKKSLIETLQFTAVFGSVRDMFPLEHPSASGRPVYGSMYDRCVPWSRSTQGLWARQRCCGCMRWLA
jgi:hypothetical protein